VNWIVFGRVDFVVEGRPVRLWQGPRRLFKFNTKAQCVSLYRTEGGGVPDSSPERRRVTRSYSVSLRLPRRDYSTKSLSSCSTTFPRPRGNTRVRALYAIPRPGTLA
jgi:hypothetical protein